MSVPVFFTREDFYGKLLPGYATIILSSYFFNFPCISNDIAATVLFIVEGPVIGYILCSVANYFFSKIFSFWKKCKAYDRNRYLSEAKIKEEYEKYLKNYAKVRIIATEREISELDSFLSFYYFCIATGPPFFVLSLFKIVKLAELGNQQEFIPFLTLSTGIVLICMAIKQYEGYQYIFRALYNETIGGHKESS